MKTTYACRCRRCKEINYIMAHSSDVEKWFDGALVQDAFPYLAPDERELLVSRICPTCWVKLFGKEE